MDCVFAELSQVIYLLKLTRIIGLVFSCLVFNDKYNLKPNDFRMEFGFTLSF